MERRFACTACGKCCCGRLPLTLDDALAHAGRFPLAMLWTVVRPGAKSFALTARLGTTAKLAKRKPVAVQITPISYLPPTMACPALAADGLCSIHAEKPLRCRTMPFYPYREEWDQADLLAPRPGWLCDTSAAAPVVYRNNEIVVRDDFDRERQALVEQAPVLRAYADRLLAMAPNVAAALEQAANKPRGGYVVLGFSAVLSRLDHVEAAAFARRQAPVLRDLAARTAGLCGAEEFHRYYRDNAAAMERLLARHGQDPAKAP
jgi:Fe-S-cluster containining protein